MHYPTTSAVVVFINEGPVTAPGRKIGRFIVNSIEPPPAPEEICTMVPSPVAIETPVAVANA